MCSPLHASLTVCRRRLWQRCSTKATTWGGPSLPTAKVGIIEYRLEDRNQSVQKRRLARLGNQALEGRLRSASVIPQLPVQTVKVRIKRCLGRLQVHHTMDSTSPRPGFKGQGHPMPQTPFLSVTTLRRGGPLPTSAKITSQQECLSPVFEPRLPSRSRIEPVFRRGRLRREGRGDSVLPLAISGNGRSPRIGTDRPRRPNRESLARRQRRVSTVTDPWRFRSLRAASRFSSVKWCRDREMRARKRANHPINGLPRQLRRLFPRVDGPPHVGVGCGKGRKTTLSARGPLTSPSSFPFESTNKTLPFCSNPCVLLGTG